MSKINDLIKELCPNGVEYKQLQEIANTFIGLATSVTKHKSSDGVILLHNSDIKQNKIVLKTIEFINKEFADKNTNKYYQYHDIATVHTGDVGTSAVIEEEYVGSMGFTTLVTRIYDFNYVNPYYLCHYFNSQLFKNDVAKVTISDRSNLNQKEFCQLIIPIPPLKVQEEIVRILNKFGELEAELEMELETRKSQYEFWRDKVFEPKETWIGKTMEELCTVITKQTGFDYSSTIKPALLNCKSNESYSFIQNKDFDGTRFNFDTDYYIPIKVANKYPKITLDSPSILFSISGKIGNVGLYELEEKAFIGGAIAICKLNSNLNNKYILYYLQSKYGQQYLYGNIKAASHLNVTVEAIRKIQIKFPSIDHQKKIVNILEHFDKLINDTTEGLPAEIELRKKQYEYYRNKLLNFEEI